MPVLQIEKQGFLPVNNIQFRKGVHEEAIGIMTDRELTHGTKRAHVILPIQSNPLPAKRVASSFIRFHVKNRQAYRVDSIKRFAIGNCSYSTSKNVGISVDIKFNTSTSANTEIILKVLQCPVKPHTIINLDTQVGAVVKLADSSIGIDGNFKTIWDFVVSDFEIQAAVRKKVNIHRVDARHQFPIVLTFIERSRPRMTVEPHSVKLNHDSSPIPLGTCNLGVCIKTHCILKTTLVGKRIVKEASAEIDAIAEVFNRRQLLEVEGIPFSAVPQPTS